MRSKTRVHPLHVGTSSRGNLLAEIRICKSKGRNLQTSPGTPMRLRRRSGNFRDRDGLDRPDQLEGQQLGVRMRLLHEQFCAPAHFQPRLRENVRKECRMLPLHLDLRGQRRRLVRPQERRRDSRRRFQHRTEKCPLWNRWHWRRLLFRGSCLASYYWRQKPD